MGFNSVILAGKYSGKLHMGIQMTPAFKVQLRINIVNKLKILGTTFFFCVNLTVESNLNSDKPKIYIYVEFQKDPIGVIFEILENCFGPRQYFRV